MNLALIMDELAAAGRTVVNRVFAYPTSKVEPPALVVAWPELVEYDQTYQRGLDKYMIPVFLVLGESGTQQGKRDQAAEWLSGSVKRALDSGAYSDGASVTVKTGEVDFLTVTGVEYLCFKFMVEVQAAGYGTPADSGHPPFNTTTEVVAYLREQNPVFREPHQGVVAVTGYQEVMAASTFPLVANWRAWRAFSARTSLSLSLSQRPAV